MCLCVCVHVCKCAFVRKTQMDNNEDNTYYWRSRLA